MKKVLQEVMMKGSLALDESIKSKNPNILGTMKGPCADFKNPTRNNNLYGRKLWENVFKDPIIKESLEDRILLGELDHPLDGRLETKATEACIVMTSYDFDDDKGLLLGTFDILPTPNGKILKSLLDCGCKIGVSSRGEGEVTQKEGVDYVDENSFTFVGFDAVVLPAVKAAKPTLQESMKRDSLKESLKKEIESATTLSELSLIKKVVENLGMPEVDSLIESINNKSQKLEGTTGSSSLIEDLESMTVKVEELTAENRSLKSSLTTSKETIGKLENDNKEASSLTESCRKSFDELSHKYERLIKKMNSKVEEIKNLNSEIDNLNEEVDRLGSQVEDLNESLASSRTSVREGKREASRLNRQIEEAEKDLSERDERIEELSSEIESLKEDLDRQTLKIENLTKSLNESKKSNASNLSAYAELKAKTSGVDPKYLKESLGKDLSVDRINQLTESISDRARRYNALPITNDPRLDGVKKVSIKSESLNPGADEELVERKTFLENYFHIKS